MWLPMHYSYSRNFTVANISQGKYDNMRLMAGDSQHATRYSSQSQLVKGVVPFHRIASPPPDLDARPDMHSRHIPMNHPRMQLSVDDIETVDWFRQRLDDTFGILAV